MPPLRVRVLPVLLVLAMSACARANRPATSASNVLTRADLDAAGSVTTYEAVQRLRPSFLRDRGPTSLVNASAHKRPVVFVDLTEYGEIESLSTFLASRIEEVRFYSGPEATTKFGSSYGAGVIQLKMRVQ